MSSAISSAVSSETISNITNESKVFDTLNNMSNIGMITDIEIHNPIDTLSEMIAKTMGVYPPRRVVTYGQ